MPESDQHLLATDPPCSLFESLVKPAIWNVLHSTDGSYRCERDLHHHLTVCLEQILPLRLGTRDRILRMEDPAIARYGTGRRGNIDFLIAQRDRTGSRQEIALEVNWNYGSSAKIYKDFCKLVDPSNRYNEAVYFAFGIGDDFLRAVKSGLERAFELLLEHYPHFALPSGLQIIVAEYKPRSKKTIVYSARASSPCAPAQMEWHEQSERLEIAIHMSAMEAIMRTDTYNLPLQPAAGTRGGASYQTAPLSEYSEHNRSMAENLFSTFRNKFPQAKGERYKGSYSIFANSVKGTAAKIVIYETGKGKVNGDWDVSQGVYILVRRSDSVGERASCSLGARKLKLGDGTIAIAPAHRERFAFERVEDVNDERILSILGACSEA
jgi:hypothetical protein